MPAYALHETRGDGTLVTGLRVEDLGFRCRMQHTRASIIHPNPKP